MTIRLVKLVYLILIVLHLELAYEARNSFGKTKMSSNQAVSTQIMETIALLLALRVLQNPAHELHENISKKVALKKLSAHFLSEIQKLIAKPKTTAEYKSKVEYWLLRQG